MIHAELRLPRAVGAPQARRAGGDLRVLAFILLGLGASGCATKKALTFSDFGSAGRAIEVSEGGARSEQRRYILADDELLLEVREPHDVGSGVYRFDLGRLERRKLEPEVAARAWSRIDRLGVSSWRKIYSPSDLGVDESEGPDWSVDMRVGEVTRVSGGNSAYPDASDPEKTVTLYSGSNSFEALKAILEPLAR